MNDIWKNLASRLSEAEDLPRRPDYSTLPKTTDVIDEEKSVRWNESQHPSGHFRMELAP